MTTEDRIKLTSTSLFLKAGLRSVSMDDIAREMGVSKKTLYKYFDNKESLIEEIVRDYTCEEQSTVCGILEKARDAIDEMFGVARHITRLFRSMSPYVMYDLQKYYPASWKTLWEFQSKFVFMTIHDNLKKGMKEGLYRTDMDPAIIAKLYVGKTFILVDEEQFPLQEFDRRTLFNEHIRYHLHGIVNKKGAALLNQYLTEEEE